MRSVNDEVLSLVIFSVVSRQRSDYLTVASDYFQFACNGLSRKLDYADE